MPWLTFSAIMWTNYFKRLSHRDAHLHAKGNQKYFQIYFNLSTEFVDNQIILARFTNCLKFCLYRWVIGFNSISIMTKPIITLKSSYVVDNSNQSYCRKAHIWKEFSYNTILTICFSVYLFDDSKLTASMCPKSMSCPRRNMNNSLHTYFFFW